MEKLRYEREISVYLHNTLLESKNMVRGFFGLSPCKDYGCAYDRIENAKKRQIEENPSYNETKEQEKFGGAMNG